MNTDELLVSQPIRRAGSGDHRDPRSIGAMEVVVIDSVAALVPRAEIEGEMETHTWGFRPVLCLRHLESLLRP